MQAPARCSESMAAAQTRMRARARPSHPPESRTWEDLGQIGWGGPSTGPTPPFYCSCVFVSVWAAAGRLLWWGGGVRCFVGVNLSSSRIHPWRESRLDLSPHMIFHIHVWERVGVRVNPRASNLRSSILDLRTPMVLYIGAAVLAAVCRWGLCLCCPGVGRCLSGEKNS